LKIFSGLFVEFNPILERKMQNDGGKKPAEDIHKMCGKLCENRFFDRPNSLNSDWFLPVCLKVVHDLFFRHRRESDSRYSEPKKHAATRERLW
jgi:hypothetical protein